MSSSDTPSSDTPSSDTPSSDTPSSDTPLTTAPDYGRGEQIALALQWLQCYHDQLLEAIRVATTISAETTVEALKNYNEFLEMINPKHNTELSPSCFQE